MANAFLFANADRVPDAAFLFPPYTAAAIAEHEIQEITNKLRHCRCAALNVRVIDDTALIETSLAGKPKFGRKNPKLRGGNRRRTGKKPAHVYSRQELEALNSDYEKDKWAQVYGALDPAVAAEYDGLVSSPQTNKSLAAAASPSRFRRRNFFQKSAHFHAVAVNGRRNHRNTFVR